MGKGLGVRDQPPRHLPRASRLGGPMDLKWQDTEDIAIRLVEEHPESDPLTVRFTDMHAWIVALPDFKDDPKKSNEKILEAIQMAWHEEYQDSKS